MRDLIKYNHKVLTKCRRIEYLLSLPESEQAYLSATEQDRHLINLWVRRQAYQSLKGWFDKQNRTVRDLRQQGFYLKIQNVTRLTREELEDAIREKRSGRHVGGDAPVDEAIGDTKGESTTGEEILPRER